LPNGATVGILRFMEDVTLEGLQEQIRLLTHVVSQLVALVERVNAESYMDTTILHHAAIEREARFRDVNAALEDLRAGLAARLSQLDAAQQAPQRDIANPL
jgi:hypothetical protein